MDDAGFTTAHIAGNSLGGYVALQLAARDRARTVTAFAPAGGWADDSYREVLAFQADLRQQAKAIAPHAHAILATPEGRRRATQHISTNSEHIPAELLAHQLQGLAACDAAPALIEHARTHAWEFDAHRIQDPVRIVWGTADRLLPYPRAAARYRTEWLPHAEWVELDGVGHCPPLDVPLEAAGLILGS
jgi:pimeloyl-ACP methyl ester carboxylesterase